MTEILLGAVVVCLLAVIGLQVALLLRKVGVDLSPLQHTLQGIDKSYERVEGAVRDEITKNRSEASDAARQSREELSNSLKAVADTLAKRFDALTQATSATLKGVSESLVNNIGEMAKLQKGQLDVFSERLDKLTQSNEQKLDKMRETIEQRLGVLQEDNAKKLAEMRQEAAATSQKTREEVTLALKTFNESVGKTINDFLDWQRRQFGGVIEQLKGLTDANEKTAGRSPHHRGRSSSPFRTDNAKKLGANAANRGREAPGDSGKTAGRILQVGQRAAGAGLQGPGRNANPGRGRGRPETGADQREVPEAPGARFSLRPMLEQVLCPDQYDKNVATKDEGSGSNSPSSCRAGAKTRTRSCGCPSTPSSLSKITSGSRTPRKRAMPNWPKPLASNWRYRIKGCAGDICDKYLNPPKTTDFGISVPAHRGAVCRSGPSPWPCRNCSSVNTRSSWPGPTTLWSILNSLQMGFRTLAIQQRSSEVWNLLAAVKTEFGKYGDVLAKVQRKLQEATNTIDTAAVRTRAIERKLRDVQELPAQDAQGVLMLEQVDGNGDGETSSQVDQEKHEVEAD